MLIAVTKQEEKGQQTLPSVSMMFRSCPFLLHALVDDLALMCVTAFDKSGNVERLAFMWNTCLHLFVATQFLHVGQHSFVVTSNHDWF